MKRVRWEDDPDRPLRFIDTGKVKIGVHYVPRPNAETFCDMEHIQKCLLPRSLGSLHPIEWPTPRNIWRWLMM
jgi:hypothetical protein